MTGSSLNFTVNYSDSEATDKYASGIDTASTRVYIDGVNQTANAEINTGSLYLRNLNLRNGEHSLTVYLKDLYGNETNTTYYFRVADPEGTEAGIAVVPQQAAPEIGKEFALYVVNVTNEMVSSADLEIEFPAAIWLPVLRWRLRAAIRLRSVQFLAIVFRSTLRLLPLQLRWRARCRSMTMKWRVWC